MDHDPFYREIVARLQGPLDPNRFQQCAMAVLRRRFPNLLPLSGGDDAGMDGSVADGEGNPWPVVATTGKDVIGNLTRSLNRQLAEGQGRRIAAVVTSQSLSNRRQRNLRDRASELGFRLIDLIEQTQLALLLYVEPEFCTALLGLSGRASALSVIPTSSRPLVGTELIGREREANWLTDASGDCVLVGQPGAGKTFLLHRMALDGLGVFACTDDIDAIATDLRRLPTPTRLLIDDAHGRLPLLAALRQYRHESLADFGIVAVSWPAAADEVRRSLDVASISVLELRRLPRRDILAVIRATGLRASDELLRRLIDQAEGLPGRAGTLARLCVLGDTQEVATGEALTRDLGNSLERLVGARATAVLAALALGGDSGFRVESVARALGLPVIDCQSVVQGLAASGVLHESSGGTLSVWPLQVRYQLVLGTFFRGPGRIDPSPLLSETRDISGTTLSVLAARHHGGIVPPDLVLALVRRAASSQCWSVYAALGEDETRQALAEHPRLLRRHASGALTGCACAAIAELLRQAVGDDRGTNAHTDHPLRVLEDWVKSARDPALAVQRRRDVVNATVGWLGDGGDVSVASRALAITCFPGASGADSSVESDSTIMFWRGPHSVAVLQQIEPLWRRALDALVTAANPNWRPLLDSLSTWLYPGSLSIDLSVSDEIRTFMDRASARMAREAASTMRDSAAAMRRLAELSDRLELDLDLPVDDDLDSLYPRREAGRWRERQEEVDARLETLAADCDARGPRETAPWLAEVDARAGGLRDSGSRVVPDLCRRIAVLTDAPDAWAQALRECGQPPEDVAPFILRIIADRGEWQDGVLAMCASSEGRWRATEIVLSHPEPQVSLLQEVVADDSLAHGIEFLCHLDRVSLPALRWLLENASPRLAAAAAVGVWQCAPDHSIPGGLELAWRRAIAGCREHEHWLKQILRADGERAARWLRSWMAESESGPWVDGTVVHSALAALSVEQRLEILSRLGPESLVGHRIAKGLVNRDPEVYVAMLERADLRDLWTYPLEGCFGEIERRLLLLALDAGMSPEAVSSSLRSVSSSWAGDESSHWQGWMERYRPLAEGRDARIREVGRCGMEALQKAVDHALRRERDEGVHGRGWRTGYRELDD